MLSRRPDPTEKLKTLFNNFVSYDDNLNRNPV